MTSLSYNANLSPSLLLYYPFTIPSALMESIRILMNKTSYPVRKDNISFTSTKLAIHNRITNGADINAKQ